MHTQLKSMSNKNTQDRLFPLEFTNLIITTPGRNYIDNMPEFKITVRNIVKQLKEDSGIFQENTDTQINEISKPTHNMKIEFNLRERNAEESLN